VRKLASLPNFYIQYIRVSTKFGPKIQIKYNIHTHCHSQCVCGPSWVLFLSTARTSSMRRRNMSHGHPLLLGYGKTILRRILCNKYQSIFWGCYRIIAFCMMQWQRKRGTSYYMCMYLITYLCRLDNSALCCGPPLLKFGPWQIVLVKHLKL
jgi:hypothetical protein